MPHPWSIHLTVGKGPPARVVRSAVVVDAPGTLCLRGVNFSLYVRITFKCVDSDLRCRWSDSGLMNLSKS